MHRYDQHCNPTDPQIHTANACTYMYTLHVCNHTSTHVNVHVLHLYIQKQMLDSLLELAAWYEASLISAIRSCSLLPMEAFPSTPPPLLPLLMLLTADESGWYMRPHATALSRPRGSLSDVIPLWMPAVSWLLLDVCTCPCDAWCSKREGLRNGVTCLGLEVTEPGRVSAASWALNGEQDTGKDRVWGGVREWGARNDRGCWGVYASGGYTAG